MQFISVLEYLTYNKTSIEAHKPQVVKVLNTL